MSSIQSCLTLTDTLTLTVTLTPLHSTLVSHLISLIFFTSFFILLILTLSPFPFSPSPLQSLPSLSLSLFLLLLLLSLNPYLTPPSLPLTLLPFLPPSPLPSPLLLSFQVSGVCQCTESIPRAGAMGRSGHLLSTASSTFTYPPCLSSLNSFFAFLHNTPYHSEPMQTTSNLSPYLFSLHL